MDAVDDGIVEATECAYIESSPRLHARGIVDAEVLARY
jgi:hypothetical protein